MGSKKVLYISGSLGLGHVTRDLAIVEELRRQHPDIEIIWLATPPASTVLEQAGETLLPESADYASDTDVAEGAAATYSLKMIKYLAGAKGAWAKKAKHFGQLMKKYDFDVVVGDEAYEVGIGVTDQPDLVGRPFVMMFDFLAVEPMTKNPLERIGLHYWNRVWVKTGAAFERDENHALFIGELEDIADKPFGFLLPNRREYAQKYYEFVGHVLRFDPADYVGKQSETRQKLGLRDAPLIVASIGGTAIGYRLLELTARSYPILKKKLGDLQMILVCGPRLSPESLTVPEGVQVRGYVPNLHEYYAASDLAVVQGGGTSTLELTALRRPFMYFPLEGWSEQEINVAGRCERHRAGVQMRFSETAPESLAEKAQEMMGKAVTYADVPTGGAKKAAAAIARFL